MVDLVLAYARCGFVELCLVNEASMACRPEQDDAPQCGCRCNRQRPCVARAGEAGQRIAKHRGCSTKNVTLEPVDIELDQLHLAVGAFAQEARFSDLGGSAFSSSPAEFGKFIADEMEKWAKVVKFAGMKPE
jgi:hypothetical protein